MQQFRTLYHLARLLYQLTPNIPALLQTTLTQMADVLACPYGALLLFTPDEAGKPPVLNPQYSIRLTQSEAERVLPLNADHLKVWETLNALGLVGYVRHGRRSVIVRDLAHDPRWPKLPHSSALPEEGSAVGVPLLDGENPYGVLLLAHTEVDYFNDHAEALLNEAALLLTEVLVKANEITAARANPPHDPLFASAVLPVLITDLAGNLLDANEEAQMFFRFNRTTLNGLNAFALHEIHSKTIDLHTLAAVRPNEELVFQAITCAGGEGVPVLVRVRRISHAGRDLLAWVEQDISAQVENERMQRDLTAMIYHDLRGPLHNINGSLSSLARQLTYEENPALVSLLQIAQRSTRQLRRMVDGLLDIQRLEAGKAVLEQKPITVRGLLLDAAQLTQPMAAEADQHFMFEIADNLPQLNGDADMLLRVLTNLLENAIKYSPDGSPVTLIARQAHADEVLIGVRDCGPGVPEDMRHEIFDKYTRVKHHNAPKGIGLGLAFCRLAVEAHGGYIWVENEPGRGATFWFALPASPLPTASEPTPPQKRVAEQARV